MNREEAVALLKQIADSTRFTFNWISLINERAGYVIQVKPDNGLPESLKPIFEKKGLAVKEVENSFVIFRKH